MTGTLYSCARSRGLRVTWGAEELGLPLDLVILEFPPRTKVENYIDLNPLGTIPAYVEGEAVLTESTAILHALAARAGPNKLLLEPEHPDYGMFLDFLYHADATLTFPQTVYMRFVRQESERGLQEAGHAYARWFAARLAKLDHRLATREYLCGSRFTIADIAIGYALYLSTLNGLSEHLTPALKTYVERLTARPAFKRALERELTMMPATEIPLSAIPTGSNRSEP
jgi:glutathione S-transferase